MQAAGTGNIGVATTAGGGLRALTAAGVLVLALVLVQMLAFAGPQAEPGSFSLERFVPSFPGSDHAATPSERAIAERVAAAPVGFVANEGQAPRSVTHLAQGPGYAFAFGHDGVRVSLVKQARSAAALSVGLEFVGANPRAEAVLQGPAGGRVDYMVGERARWRAGLATQPVLVYRDLWPGIDMAFKGSGGKLKYEFRLAAGADPSKIQLAYQGAQSLSLSSAGALQVHTERGVLKDAAPVSYQQIDGRKVPVESSYALANGNGYGFTTGAYDQSRPLVIDPGLEYCTYLGGGGPDSGLDVVVRGNDAYISGATASPNFPTTANGFKTSPNGSQDAFMSRIDTRKSGAASLEYSTFLGGGGPDAALALEVTGHDVFLTGFTGSPNFPVTTSAYDPSPNGGGDVFVSRIDTSKGTAGLEYSTYLGGTAPTVPDVGLGIGVRGNDAYVTGTAGSADYPVSANAYDTIFNGGVLDAFVTRLDTGKAGASGLEYSTFLGGTGQEDTVQRPGTSIAVVGHSAYVASVTTSSNFPVTRNAFDRSYNGGQDAFVTRLDMRKGAHGLRYSTYLGGSGDDVGRGIVARGRDAFVTGGTNSAHFPVTKRAFRKGPAGAQDVFVTRLDTKRWRRFGLEYSTYLGGGADDLGRAIAVRGDDAFITGETSSGHFPVLASAYDTSANGGGDAFLSRLDTKPRRGHHHGHHD